MGNPSTGFNGGAAGTVTVAGANVPAPAIALATTDAVALATTYHNHSPAYDSYSVDLTVSPNLKIVAKATVVSGNGTSPPVDLGPQICTNCGAALRGNVLATVTPAVGDDYVLAVTTDDGTSCNLTAKVTGVITGWAAKTAPASNATGVSLTPDFTWTAPSPAPTGAYSYQLIVWPATGGNSVWTLDVPSGTTTVHYNSDGHATALVSGTQYLWTVRVSDAFGNQSDEGSGQFTTL